MSTVRLGLCQPSATNALYGRVGHGDEGAHDCGSIQCAGLEIVTPDEQLTQVGVVRNDDDARSDRCSRKRT